MNEDNVSGTYRYKREDTNMPDQTNSPGGLPGAERISALPAAPATDTLEDAVETLLYELRNCTSPGPRVRDRLQRMLDTRRAEQTAAAIRQPQSDSSHPADVLAAAVEAAQQALNQITGPAWREIMPVRDRLVAALAAYRVAQADQSEWLPIGELPAEPGLYVRRNLLPHHARPEFDVFRLPSPGMRRSTLYSGLSREKVIAWGWQWHRMPIEDPPAPPADGEAKP